MRNHKGPLPPHQKELGLEQYKYHIAFENNSIPNYISEKLVDSILCECLTFYWGAPNWRQHIDERAIVWLEGSNLELDCQTILRAVREDWWSQRIEHIRAMKKKLIDEMAFVPRLHKFINSRIRADL